jgi:hypothetical protein
MRNAVMTKWDLTPQEKFQGFLSELIDYLQKNLIQVKRFPDSLDSELIWICRENYTNIMRGCGDRDFEWAIYSRRFCEIRNFYWPEVRDMIEEELDCIVTCDCHILEAKSIGLEIRNRPAG